MKQKKTQNQIVTKWVQKVEQIIKRFNPLKDIIYRYVNDVGPEQVGRIYKEIAISLGFRLGGIRLPIISIPQHYKEKIKKAVEKMVFWNM